MLVAIWGFTKLLGYLVGVLVIRGSYSLGIHIRGPPIFVDPHMKPETLNPKPETLNPEP